MSLLSPPLQAFQAIVKHKTVHGAAAAIHLTQTAVTQRICVLEAQLKTALFIRTRRGMMLTPEGEALFRYCQAVRDIEGEALAKIKHTGIETDISVCITGPTSVMKSRIIPQCVAVIKKFPKLQLHFDINDLENRLKLVRSGDAQLAIIKASDTVAEMEKKILKSEHYVLVGSPAWKKRKLKEVIQQERIVDFDPSDQLTLDYLKHYKLFEHARHDRHFANRTESLALMISEGLGYGLLTKEFSKPYLENGKLALLHPGHVYEHEIALVWYERPESPKYFSALINAMS